MHGCLHARAAKHVRGCMRSLSKLMCVLAQRYEVIDPMQGCKHRRGYRSGDHLRSQPALRDIDFRGAVMTQPWRAQQSDRCNHYTISREVSSAPFMSDPTAEVPED